MKHTDPATLMSATALSPAVPRGILNIRAEAAADPNRVVAELQTAWTAFKAENDAALKAVGGRVDALQAEKIDKINAAVTELQGALTEANKKVAALQVGGGDGKQAKSPEAVAHKAAFEQFFRRGVDATLRDLEVKAKVSVGSDPDGGYTVPVDMDSAIGRVLGKVSTMRSIATVRAISTASYKKLIGQGGATSGWVSESASRGETSTPVLNELSFPTHEIYANPAATQSLLDDSAINIEEWLASEVATEFAEQEGDAFINGDGVAKPRGILKYTTVANASYAWGKIGFKVSGVSADITDASNNGTDAILDTIYSLKRGYRQNARFLMNDLVMARVRKLKDGDKNYLWQPAVQVGEPSQLLGYAVETDDNMPDVGANAFPIAFADWARAYVIVDRIGTRVLRDPYTNKPYVMFYTTKRVGGGIQNFEAIKLLKCST